MLQWVCSRPIQGIMSTCGRVIYSMKMTDRAEWCIWPHNLFFDGEELLSACTEHKVPGSASGLEKGMCARRACPFSPALFPLSQTLPWHLSSHNAHAICGWSPGIYKWKDIFHWPLEWVRAGTDSGKEEPLLESLAAYGWESTGSSWRQLNHGRVYWNCK